MQSWFTLSLSSLDFLFTFRYEWYYIWSSVLDRRITSVRSRIVRRVFLPMLPHDTKWIQPSSSIGTAREPAETEILLGGGQPVREAEAFY